MENTDKTLLDMQQQLQQLKEKLESQKIVNDRVLRKSFRQTTLQLKFKANIPVIAGVVAILCSPSFLQMGISVPFVLFTDVIMLGCIAVTIIYNQHIPRSDKDLVTATEELRKFRKLNADWIKIGLPMLAVWLALFIWELVRNGELSGTGLYALISGLSVGIVLGLVIGFRNRRQILDGADDLIAQIEELREED